MKKRAFVGGAGALSAAAFLCAPVVRAADHLDSASVKVAGNEMADINDVYTWMTSDGDKVNLAMTVSPADPGTRAFGPTIQYVFHVEQHAAYGTAGAEKRVICTFASNTDGQCWVANSDGTTADYVSGDLSAATGRASVSNRFRVFAGRRSDPFFFNLSGFLTAKRTVNANVSSADLNDEGCPTGTNGIAFPSTATATTVRNQLSATPDGTTENGPCAQDTKDCFATFNVMAIVVQVDKDLLVDSTNSIVSVWASTHAAPE